MNYIFYLIKKITVKLALKPATDSFVYIDNLHALFYMAMKKKLKRNAIKGKRRKIKLELDKKGEKK